LLLRLLKLRMKLNIVSKKHGWYIAKITGCFRNFKNVVTTDLETIKQYNLIPGRYIKISNIYSSHSAPIYKDRFIIMPDFDDIKKNPSILKEILDRYKKLKYRYIDKNYLQDISKIINDVYNIARWDKELQMTQLMDFSNTTRSLLNISMSESWMRENKVGLGENVLLRNDMPSPVIL